MNLDDLASFQEQDGVSPFYICFTDAALLICCFFALIIGMSKVDIGSFEKIRTGFSGSVSGTLVELADKLKDIAAGPPKVSGVSVEMAEDGIRLDLESAALFESGSAVLKPNSLDHLRKILSEILKTSYTLDIEGHADDQNLFRVEDKEIVTNWSLSGHRASTVVYHLEKFGFARQRLRIVGYASNKPKTSIKTKQGAELDEARAENRRVTILVK